MYIYVCDRALLFSIEKIFIWRTHSVENTCIHVENTLCREHMYDRCTLHA
jgi:hypothetical protein